MKSLREQRPHVAKSHEGGDAKGPSRRLCQEKCIFWLKCSAQKPFHFQSSRHGNDPNWHRLTKIPLPSFLLWLVSLRHYGMKHEWRGLIYSALAIASAFTLKCSLWSWICYGKATLPRRKLSEPALFAKLSHHRGEAVVRGHAKLGQLSRRRQLRHACAQTIFFPKEANFAPPHINAATPTTSAFYGLQLPRLHFLHTPPPRCWFSSSNMVDLLGNDIMANALILVALRSDDSWCQHAVNAPPFFQTVTTLSCVFFFWWKPSLRRSFGKAAHNKVWIPAWCTFINGATLHKDEAWCSSSAFERAKNALFNALS